MAPLVQLGDLVRIEKGKKAAQIFEQQSANTRRYLQIDDLRPDAKRKFVEPFACPVASKADVVIAWDGANAGTVSCNLDGYIGSTLAVLRPSTQQLFAPYLSRFLEGKFDYLQKNSTGATVPHVSRDVLDSLELPLPSLNEQQRIAGQLEQADRLRRTRRYALELSDSFLPAAFLELFGDPRQANVQWELDEFANLGTLDRGRSRHRPRNAPHLYGGPYPFIQTGDVTNAKSYIRSHGQTYSEEGLKQSKLWPTGTLCITIAANIAETAILTYPACFPDSVVGFIPNDRVKIEFVQFWLGFLQEILEKTAPESAQKNINLEILRELRCPVPPLQLQQKFAALVERHEHLRATQREALRQAEHLFQTLLHKAFSEGV